MQFLTFLYVFLTDVNVFFSNFVLFFVFFSVKSKLPIFIKKLHKVFLPTPPMRLNY